MLLFLMTYVYRNSKEELNVFQWIKKKLNQTTNSEATKLWSIIADILGGGSCVRNKA